MKSYKALLAATALASSWATAAWAVETINLTIASSHPQTIHWVGVMDRVFKPAVNRILEEKGSDYRIAWTEAYGGSLYKYRETLSAVAENLTDIGWIGTLWESSALPLQNVTYFAPFATDDLGTVLSVVDSIQEEYPEITATWEKNNVVFLGGAGTDSYHLLTNFPINTVEDLKGRKISAPGVSATWLEGTGAIPVDGGLTTYYTDIQTGVSEGTLSFATGILPTKVHEVAPYITKVNIGAMYLGAVGMNKDRFDSMPEDVQKAIVEAGKLYRDALAKEITENSEAAMAQMEKEGAKISTLPEAERKKWVDGLPDIAAKWVETNEAAGLPAKLVMKEYMARLKAAGKEPARDWSAGLKD
ncbi:C4-dicarboxylate TRAP transporter substrate-binding protein [Nitratireductor indicus]|uniref:TRAP-type C4-dicarboxylate transporter periplasmic component-like protein n=1 Tax=Nitratireductor indicus C115 TaxID=1231190 RepID=K2NU89_9HYPH|nr:C4-dicarboxylate TRAP transporter substrate-binding protein [Nitratireductor indicus]EKF41424.1 TRAP-type C4-dicarboxylate transporter periplasmic component-like protein [Nitratireductor indicus C115]MDS1138421.1 C4-dicarboxylate TRAP transporter substrate-binding protein [Nitratireductor indicus]SFQ71976.1 TRAP-type C4-dicarboxylate transport system, substrate-binding protein [Nitratireductor indicus]